MLRVDVDAPSLTPQILRLDAAPALMEVRAQEALERATSLVSDNVRDRTPVDTGRLRQSVHSVVVPLEGRVRTTVFYAPMVEAGRGPVVARRARALRFPVVSGYIFRRSVGSAKGAYMFREGLRASISGIRDAFMDVARAVARAIAGK